MRIAYFVISLTLYFSFCVPLWAEDFHPWSEKVFAHISKEYGPQAEKRVRYLHELIKKNQDRTVEGKLRLVNDTMNKLPWIADKEHWEKADYWATPLEALATFGGDCEDIAIMKWLMLRFLGIPNERLRLAYVKVKATGENHMILAYIDKVDLSPEERLPSTWILDNIDPRLLQVKDRKDLLGIYSTDVDGTMTIFEESENGPTIRAVRENTRMAKLADVRQRINENLEFYRKLNDGRPLLPY